MRAVVNRLKRDEKSALLQWLTRQDSFQQDVQQPLEDESLEYNGEVVTDNAIGEAAYSLFYGIDRRLVSMNPSSWLTSPLPVDYRENGRVRGVQVLNYWDIDCLKSALTDAPVSLESWEDLEAVVKTRCTNLTFSRDSFEPLQGNPFGKGAAERLLALLSVLHNLKTCFDERGSLTPEGRKLLQDHFTGKKSWFSDSSDTEKRTFKNELTFPHPTLQGQYLFCAWHGKVKTPQFRIHFSWPIRAQEPLYIVYVGPKLTKR